MANKKDEEPDLVPYYAPGTTEPQMVPRGSVPGGLPEVVDAPEKDGVITGDKSEPKAPAKKATARKK